MTSSQVIHLTAGAGGAAWCTVLHVTLYSLYSMIGESRRSCCELSTVVTFLELRSRWPKGTVQNWSWCMRYCTVLCDPHPLASSRITIPIYCTRPSPNDHQFIKEPICQSPNYARIILPDSHITKPLPSRRDSTDGSSAVGKRKKPSLAPELLPVNKHAPTALEKQRVQVAKLLQVRLTRSSLLEVNHNQNLMQMQFGR